VELLKLLEPFRFIKRYRERQAERLVALATERAAERAHQLEMLDTLFSKMVELQRTNNAPLLEIAKAQQANSEIFGAWMKSFSIPDSSPALPLGPPADEWEFDGDVAELKRLASELPPEYSLGFQLDELEVDRDDA
jgi:hypothetical protein